MQGRVTGHGWRIWGAGITAMGMVSLFLGDFDPGQPVPSWFAARIELAYAADVLMILAGLAVQWRRTATRATFLLTFYYLAIVVIVMNGCGLIAHPEVYGIYEAIAEQLALAAAGMVILGEDACLDPNRAARLSRGGRIAFGLCAIVFGGAHFVYMNLTAPLVPSWLPPSQLFWGYLTGVAQIAAGMAIVTNLQARMAATLLTIMYAAFSFLVHIPFLIGAPHNPFFWTENVLNLSLVGAAWVVADSLRWSHLLSRPGRFR